MKFINAIFGFLCLLSVVCDRITGPVSSEAKSFFPLAVGNTWQYTVSGNEPDGRVETWIVTRHVLINGLPYFEIEKSYSQSDIVNRDLYRAVGDQLLMIAGGSDTIQLLADFSLKKNETFISTTGHFTLQGVITDWEKNKRTIAYDSPEVVDEEHEITFTRGVGISGYRSLAWGVGSSLVSFNLKEQED
jgi:hypothetical protein